MPDQYWEKFVSRTEDVLHWDSSISMRREPLRVGPIYWGTRNDLALKSGTALPTWYEHVSPIESQTNLGDFCGAVSSELDAALDEAIAIIDRDIWAVAGSTREDARKLYERFRFDMGLMLFGLVCNAVPAGRLKEILGDRFSPLEEQILRPYRQTLLGREARAIFAIQKEGTNKSEEWFVEEAKKLAEEFGFIHSEYVSESWTPRDYEMTLRGPHMEVISMPELDEKDFDVYEIWLTSVVQKLSYLHDEGKAALVRTNWALRQTLKNLGLDDFMLHLTEQEFLHWTDTGEMPTLSEIEKRNDYFAILSQGNNHKFLFGKDSVLAFMKEQGFGNVSIVENIQLIKGSVASKGIVQGIVRIVATQKESKNLKDGEILVASMTTPAYIDAMRRAAAYVTDEGGIICHAAIVSREFKKPCIVGTKIATQVLHDGDLVEVDADNGVIKIIH
jgi:phosphohistidine swiveling domain-containing protein